MVFKTQMTRRSFFSTLAKAAVGFTILPSATTYVRNWHGIYVPTINKPYDFAALMDYLSARFDAEVLRQMRAEKGPWVSLMDGSVWPEKIGLC